MLCYTVDTDATDNDELLTSCAASTRRVWAWHARSRGCGSVCNRGERRSSSPTACATSARFAVTQDGGCIAIVSCIDDTVISRRRMLVDIWGRQRSRPPPTDVYRVKAASPHAWLENLSVRSPEWQIALRFCAIFDVSCRNNVVLKPFSTP